MLKSSELPREYTNIPVPVTREQGLVLQDMEQRNEGEKPLTKLQILTGILTRIAEKRDEKSPKEKSTTSKEPRPPHDVVQVEIVTDVAHAITSKAAQRGQTLQEFLLNEMEESLRLDKP